MQNLPAPATSMHAKPARTCEASALCLALLSRLVATAASSCHAHSDAAAAAAAACRRALRCRVKARRPGSVVAARVLPRRQARPAGHAFRRRPALRMYTAAAAAVVLRRRTAAALRQMWLAVCHAARRPPASHHDHADWAARRAIHRAVDVRRANRAHQAALPTHQARAAAVAAAAATADRAVRHARDTHHDGRREAVGQPHRAAVHPRHVRIGDTAKAAAGQLHPARHRQRQRVPRPGLRRATHGTPVCDHALLRLVVARLLRVRKRAAVVVRERRVAAALTVLRLQQPLEARRQRVRQVGEVDAEAVEVGQDLAFVRPAAASRARVGGDDAEAVDCGEHKRLAGGQVWAGGADGQGRERDALLDAGSQTHSSTA
eukprot:364372-Chlamydomonas_euryale.AAC.2